MALQIPGLSHLRKLPGSEVRGYCSPSSLHTVIYTAQADVFIVDVATQRIVSSFCLQPHLIEFAYIREATLLVVYEKRNQHVLRVQPIGGIHAYEVTLPKQYRCKSVEVGAAGDILVGTDRGELLVVREAQVVRCIRVHQREHIAVTLIKYIPSIKVTFAGLSNGSLKLLSEDLGLLNDLQDAPENRESSHVVGVEFLQKEIPQLLVIREQPFSVSIVNTNDGLVEIYRNRLERVERLDKDASLLQLSSIEHTLCVFSVLCKGVIHVFRYSYPDALPEQPVFSYTFTDYEWTSLLHVCVPENSVSVLAEEPRLDVMCFYEGGASVVVMPVEPRIQSTLCSSVLLHSVDSPLILKPETLSHILADPVFADVPTAHPDAPEPDKIRLIDLLSEFDCMDIACEFVTRRKGHTFVIRDLTVFLYFCDAELRIAEEKLTDLEDVFTNLVSGSEGNLDQFFTDSKKVKQRLYATRQLLSALQSRGAAVYSPERINRDLMQSALYHWKTRSPLPGGLSNFLTKAKLREFVSAVVTWTDGELLEKAEKRCEELRLKGELLTWVLRNDSLAGFFGREEWDWTGRIRGKETATMEKIRSSVSLSTLNLDFSPSPLLLFQQIPDIPMPPSSLSSIVSLLSLPPSLLHFAILYLLRDLCHQSRSDEAKLLLLERIFRSYVAEFQVSQEIVDKVEGMWILDLCCDPTHTTVPASLSDALTALASARLTSEEKAQVFTALYTLSHISYGELLLWGQYIGPEIDDNWPWYLQTLIETGQIPKAFHTAEELLSADGSRPVYEVFLETCRGKKVEFEAVYLPWRRPERFEEALRRVHLEGLVQSFRLARQRYREVGDMHGVFSSVIQRNAPQVSAPSLSMSARQSSTHRPRLPIENFPAPGSGRAPPQQNRRESGVTPKRLEFPSGQESSVSRSQVEEMTLG